MIRRQSAFRRAERLRDALIGVDYRLTLIRIGLALVVLVRHNDYLRGFWHPKHYRWVHGPEFGPATWAPSEPHLHAPLWPHLDVVANFAGVLVELRTALAVLLLLGVFPSFHALLLAVVSFVLMASDRFQYTHHLWFLYSGAFLFGLGGLLRRPGVLTLLRCQLAVVYLAAGLAKLNSVWLSGEELRAFAEFGIVQSATLESAAMWVGWSALAVAMACGELLLPALLAFRRTRTLGMVSALAFHAAIEATMTISTFGITMVVFLLSYLPPRLLHSGATPSEPLQPSEARFRFRSAGSALALALLSPLGAAAFQTRVGSYRMFTELFHYELTLRVDGEPTSTAVLLPHLGRDAARIVRLANGRGVGEVSAELLEGALPQVNELLCAVMSDASEVVSSLTLRPLAHGASRTTRSVRRCSDARGHSRDWARGILAAH